MQTPFTVSEYMAAIREGRVCDVHKQLWPASAAAGRPVPTCKVRTRFETMYLCSECVNNLRPMIDEERRQMMLEPTKHLSERISDASVQHYDREDEKKPKAN